MNNYGYHFNYSKEVLTMPLQKYHDKLTDLQTDGAAGHFYNFARKIAQKLYENKQSLDFHRVDLPYSSGHHSTQDEAEWWYNSYHHV